MIPRAGVSASSDLAADAGARIAKDGGNAVDAAIAACLVSAVTEPGMVALGAGGYVVIWPSEGNPIAIDGGVEMPGRGLSADRFGMGAETVHLDYFDGTDALVGAGTVATPGALAAFAEASARFGRMPWRELMLPAIEVVKAGFPMRPPSHRYLTASHQLIFGREPESFAAIHDNAGELLSIGDAIHVPHLADSLQLIADEGVSAFYRGDLAVAIAACIKEGQGILTREDLAAYQPIVSEPMRYTLGPLQLASAAPSAIGGSLLGVMVTQAEQGMPDSEPWGSEWLQRVVEIQNDVLGYRAKVLDVSPDFGDQARAYFHQQLGVGKDSASTVHNSVVDSQGNACSITLSAGYGSGVMPPGTGIWLNNCLGELELNCTGFHSLPPATRLLSNMAPTTGRSVAGEVLSLGSPGSGRITTAQFQTLLNLVVLEWPLEKAIAHPRVHVTQAGPQPLVHIEPGLTPFEGGIRWHPMDQLDTYFGGVGAVMLKTDSMEAATDCRRSGAVGFA
ncbi:MAG: gamma-glutamyltransferase [Lysobacterales bacterium]